MFHSLTDPRAVGILLVVLSQITLAQSANRISCYSCDWNQSSGCKTKASVTKDDLETNCTICYKNVIPYQEGLAAAKGSRRCLQNSDIKDALGYTGKAECWSVNGSLHCYCMESKCNRGEISHSNSKLLMLTVGFLAVLSKVVGRVM